MADPKRTGGARDDERDLLRVLESREQRGAIRFGAARHLLDEGDDRNRVVGRHGGREAGVEAPVEVGDEIAEPLVRLHLLSHELPDADRNVHERLE